MEELEPPTEPLPGGGQAILPAGGGQEILPAGGIPPPPSRQAGSPVLHNAFSETRYRFTTGLRAGEVAPVRADDGRIVLSYRSFATVAGVVAALVTGIVLVAGLAATLLLVTEESYVRAAAALTLTLVFSFFIALLVPRVQVTLYDEHHPALTLSQRTVFPAPRYLVAAPNGTALAELRRSPFSRLGRHRWSVAQNGRVVAEAFEESTSRALVRKFLGKFSRRFETNVLLTSGGIPIGRIVRRPEHGAMDVLELTNDALDRRVAVALAALILGREP